jgi:hypothetical protein
MKRPDSKSSGMIGNGEPAVLDEIRKASLISFVLSLLCAATELRADPVLPTKSGDYTFHHRDAEFPRSKGFPVKVSIRGYHITVVNPKPYGPMPAGVLEDATLMWHPKSKQWIIGHSDADRDAPDVGGCGDGPNVIDFKTRIIWTCEGGV